MKHTSPLLPFKHSWLLVFGLCLLQTTALAQTPPLLTITEPEAEVQLESVGIDVEVAGNIATTTTTLVFYNPNNRILEGELNFPLAEGQEVFRYALDVNGKLREGVVVEKDLGRKAFEAVVRQSIDPGLLEKTVGNNYKTRLYPIPANGRKKVVIGYEEILGGGREPLYLLTANYGKVADFKITVTVVKTGAPPTLRQNSLTNLTFDNWESIYRANKSLQNEDITGNLSFSLPTQTSARVYRQQGNNDDDYFYATLYPEIVNETRSKPKSVTIAWDVSQSGAKRDIEKETDLLARYLKYCKNVSAEVVLFSSSVAKSQLFKIRNGNSDELITFLKSLTYDGGTALKKLLNSPMTGEELLLFSDGISNLDETDGLSSEVPVYGISSQGISNTALLTQLATTSGGDFINLNRTTTDEALSQLKRMPYQLVNVKFNADVVSEIYPEKPVNLKAGQALKIAGKIKSGSNSTLILKYGRGNEVRSTSKVEIGSDLNDFPVFRLWAKAKVAELSVFAEENKEDIIEVAKAHQLVTDYTSLIVLDRMEDYVRYEITPPAELLVEYQELLMAKKAEESAEEENLVTSLTTRYQKRSEWWNRTFKIPEKRKKPVVTDSVRSTQRPQPRPPALGSAQNQRSRIESEPVELPPIIEVADEEEISEEITMDEAAFDAFGETASDSFDDEDDMFMAASSSGQGDSEDSFAMEVFAQVDAANIQASLYLLDGIVLSKEELEQLDPAEIAQTNSIAPGNETAIAIYGPDAKGGVVLMVSNAAPDFRYPDEVVVLFAQGPELKAWTPDEPYLVEIKRLPPDEQYDYYLAERNSYKQSPGFYLAIGDHFLSSNQKETGLKVLSNIAELSLENHELLKVMAHKYDQLGLWETSLYFHQKLVDLRPDEPHSKRGKALALQAAGKYQEALDLFLELLTWKFDDDISSRFPYWKPTVLHEMNQLIALHGDQLDTGAVPKEWIIAMPVDIRIVMTWNSLETDLDLWVEDPLGDKCGHSRKLTDIGGRLTYDYISGYGPEEFMIKKAIPGTYQLSITYYDQRQQKISGPVTLQVSIFTNYGRPNQKVEKRTVQLKKAKDEIKVGEIVWE